MVANKETTTANGRKVKLLKRKKRLKAKLKINQKAELTRPQPPRRCRLPKSRTNLTLWRVTEYLLPALQRRYLRGNPVTA